MSRTGEVTVRLVRKDQVLELRVSQLTVDIIGKAFGVIPSTVWLREEIGHRAFFPEENGEFSEMEAMADELYSLFVEGDNSPKTAHSLETSSARLSQSPTSKDIGSSQQQLSTGLPKKSSKAVSVKIILADLKLGALNKPEFTPIDVAYCEITEETANAPYISSFVKQQYGDNYILTSSDGLEIKDFSGTRGVKFWKSVNRKLYAISEDQLPTYRGKKRARTSLPVHSKETPPREESPYDTLLSKMSKIDKGLQDVQVAMWTRKCPMKMIEPLRISITATFRCKICHTTPLRPPVIVAKCCNNILGCQRCVDIWYSQDGRSPRACPLCNKGGKSETLVLKGLDEFLDDIRPIMEESQE